MGTTSAWRRRPRRIHNEIEQGEAATTELALQNAVGNHAVARLLQREDINNNPTDLSGTSRTRHATPTLADSADAPTAARAGDERGARFVKPIATELAPLDVGPARSPRGDLVYQERPAAEPGFEHVNGIHGTLIAPLVGMAADNSLFVDNRPQPSDIEQYGIGDCYGLATIISIASRDPGRIMSMMAPDGNGGAAVTFHRRIPPPAPAPGTAAPATPPAATYETSVVHADGTLAFEVAGPGVGAFVRGARPGGRRLHGAQLRSGQTPVRAVYWSGIASNQLEVHRDETYQMARWAPVLEKAWARFAEVHGQYGQGGTGSRGTRERSSTTGVGTATSSGYEAINGGWSHAVLTAFYGAAAEPGGTGGVQTQDTNFVAGAGTPLVMANLPVIDTLFRLQGRGSAAATGDTDAPVITATSSSNPIAARLVPAITALRSDPDWLRIRPRTQGRIDLVAQRATAYQTALTTTAGMTQAQYDAAVAAAFASLVRACISAVAVGETYSLLQREGRSAATMEVVELLLDLRNAGTDSSPGQRNVYTEHVYSVVSAAFSPISGSSFPDPMPEAALRPGTVYPLIDAATSTVTLQNPHHSNEPDAVGRGDPARSGDGPASGGASDGVFTFTLAQFLRNFTSVQSGTFTRS